MTVTVIVIWWINLARYVSDDHFLLWMCRECIKILHVPVVLGKMTGESSPLLILYQIHWIIIKTIQMHEKFRSFVIHMLFL